MKNKGRTNKPTAGDIIVVTKGCNCKLNILPRKKEYFVLINVSNSLYAMGINKTGIFMRPFTVKWKSSILYTPKKGYTLVEKASLSKEALNKLAFIPEKLNSESWLLLLINKVRPNTFTNKLNIETSNYYKVKQ